MYNHFPKLLSRNLLTFAFCTILLPLLATAQDCQLEVQQFIVGPCDDNGTPSDPADDFFTLAFSVTPQNGSDLYFIDYGSPFNSFEYGMLHAINLPADCSEYLITFTDAQDPACFTTATAFQCSCSDECLIYIPQLIVGDCTSPDSYELTMAVEIINGGVGGQYEVYDAISGSYFGQNPYGVTISFDLPTSSTEICIMDADDPGCFTCLFVTPPDCDICQTNLFSNAIANCPENANNAESACEKTCAYATVNYVADIPGDITQIEWNVQGAESYTAEGNELIVEWGAPGSGQVAFTGAGYASVEHPLAIYCAPSGDFSPNGEIAYYIQVFGGNPPYQLNTPFGVYNFGSPSFLTLPAIPSLSTISVSDASGTLNICEVSFNEDPGNCDSHPIVEVLDYDCSPQDGLSIAVNTYGGTPPYTFVWSGNGQSFTTQNIEQVTPGDYSLSITDSNGCSTYRLFEYQCNFDQDPVCEAENSICVDILENAVAEVATAPPAINGVVEICSGQEIYFENNSANADYFTWDFGTAQPFTSNDVSFIYDNPGSFLVSLIARNECLCSDTTFINVVVSDAPSPEINCTGTVCAGDAVEYTTEANCGTYNWTVIDGIITDGGGASDNFVTVDWGNGPAGIIELTVAGCDMIYCPDPVAYQVSVIADVPLISGPDKVCKGETVNYSIPDFNGASFFWTVSQDGQIQSGQGTSSILVYWNKNASPGLEWVRVEYGNCYLDCGGEDIYDVLITDEFYANGEISACANTSTAFIGRKASNDNPVPCNWFVYNPDETLLWSSPAPATTVDIDWPNTPGIYEITAFVDDPSGYCKDKYNLFLEVEAQPVPPLDILGETLICSGNIYTYEVDSDLFNTSFSWLVTDGANTYPVQGSAINVAWGNQPPYSLSVYQTNTSGLPCASESISKNIMAIPGFGINGPEDVCRNATSIYTTDNYENTNYTWSISPEDAGTIISGENTATIEVYWNRTGNASILLDLCGLQEVQNILVHELPEPEVIPPAGVCPGETAAVAATENFSAYDWKNESGSTVSTLPQPDLPGGFYELQVTNEFGCVASVAFELPVFLSPEVNITTQGLPFYCPANEQPPLITGLDTDEGYAYEWYFNGNPTGQTTATITGVQFGTYYLQVTDINNCIVQSNTVTITEDCIPFGEVPGCVISGGSLGFNAELQPVCNDYYFENTSQGYIPGSLSWEFLFPNGGFSSQENTTYSYPQAGYFHPVLWGTLPSSNSPGGCSFGVTQDVVVPAVANFDFSSSCEGETTFFTDKTTFIPGTNIISWDWNFGDPTSPDNTSNLQNPEHNFTSPGIYNIELTVTHGDGCTSTISKSYTVYPPPQLDFPLPDIECEATPLSFPAVSNGSIISYAWNFDDPGSGAANTADSEAAHHAFSAPGSYNVTLTGSDIRGCEIVVSKIINITTNSLSGDIDIYPSSTICEGDSTSLDAPVGGTIWEWSDGSTESYIVVKETGVYSVTVTDDDGCIYVPPAIPVDVLPIPFGTIRVVEQDAYGQAVNYNYDNYGACYGEDVYLEIIDNPGYSYAWSSGGNGVEVIYSDERENLLDVGVYDFTVTITDNANGCTSVAGPLVVSIYELPEQPVLSSTPTGPLCNGTASILSVQNPQPGHNYFWSNGALGQSINTNVPGEYTVRVVNQNGCENKSEILEIFKGPEALQIPGGCHTRCNPDTICLPDIPDVASWQWYFNGSPMPPPQGNDPELVMENSGDYYAVLTDINGCSATSETLTVDLQDAFGSITGQVWFDVNDNGFIDSADTLMQDVSILLEDGNALSEMNASDANGNYGFSNIPSVDYTLTLQDSSLPPYIEAYENIQLLALEGCDDEEEIVWLCHKVCPVLTAAETLQVCPGEEAFYEGLFYPVGTMEDILLVTETGCDSVVSLTVNELPPLTETLVFGACSGSTYNFENNEIPAGDSLQLSLTASNGCDSLLTVFVEENQVFDDQIAAAVCEGEFFDYNGNLIPAGTIQTFDFLTVNGCDSTITVVVNALPVLAESLFFSACSGSSYNFENNEIPAGDSLQLSFISSNGCDSLLTVFVEENLNYDNQFTEAACEDSFFDFNGNLIPAGTTQTFDFLTVNGCDSTITITVDALPIFTESLNFTACSGSTYNFENNEIPAGDSLQLSYTSSNGCDSLLTVFVAENPTYSDQITGQACAGEFFDYNGNLIPAGTTQDFNFLTVNGCDSTISVVVDVVPVLTESLFFAACPGSSYNYDNNEIPAGDSLQLSLTASNGCDSLLAVFVEEYLTYDNQISGQACEDEFFDYNGNLIPAGTAQTFDFLTVNGCDSMVTVVVDVVPTLTGSLFFEACSGSSYNYDNIEIPAGDSLQLSFTGSNGCDSLLTVFVTANETYNDQLTAQACENEFFDYNGNMIQAGSQQVFNFLTENGCDSIITVVVEPIFPVETLLPVDTCEGGSFTYMDTEIFPGEEAVFTLTSQDGCDSIVTVQVNGIVAGFSTTTIPLCPGEFYLAGDNNSYPPGTDTTIVLTSSDGCDSFVTLVLPELPVPTFTPYTEISCWNKAEGVAYFDETTGGTPPYFYSMNGVDFFEVDAFENLAPGDYTVYLQDANACTQEAAITIEATPQLAATGEVALMPCAEDSMRVRIELASGIETFPEFLWPDGTTGNTAMIYSPGTYPVSITNACETVVAPYVVAPEAEFLEEIIYVPNVFSPNADGINDLFICSPHRDAKILNFEIHLYNRWGAVLFETTDITEGWDGVFKEELLQIGVYVYWLRAEVEFCHGLQTISRKGDVTIVR